MKAMTPNGDSPSPQMSLPLEPNAPTADWRSQVPTVSELTRRIRGHLENTFFDVWVRGEISNFRKPVSGHAYFILKDASSQLRAVMFRPHLMKIKFQLKDGTEVLAHGKIAVYEARGEYQIVCDTMEPVGMGALQLAFEQLKKKLLAEGLFAPERKKKLPFLPKRIGVVTSATGAAIRDIIKVLSRRFPNREILVIPASVQGEKAGPEIVASIERAVRWNRERPDRSIEVLLVGRGGGSLEDLWPFNEESVARAIAQCPIPIISCVGHEIDFTIADFVADVRAPTPSAAAEIVVPKKEELTLIVETHAHRLRNAIKKRVENLRIHLDHLAQRLIDPRKKIEMLRENIRNLLGKMTVAMQTRCRLSRQRMEHVIQQLNLVSPLQVIGRGYSITSDEKGNIVRSVNASRPGDVLTTRVVDGVIKSEVLSQTEKPL